MNNSMFLFIEEKIVFTKNELENIIMGIFSFTPRTKGDPKNNSIILTNRVAQYNFEFEKIVVAWKKFIE
jgi:hypothetical protein